MSKLTQGTMIYFIDPSAPTVVQTVDCATSFNPGGNPAGELDDTCLADTTASTRPGLRKPTAASLSVNADPANASHVLLHTLSQTDPIPLLKFAVGWSDGTAPPTAVAGEFVLPTTRSWYAFDGYVADFPFDFGLNALVTSQVSITRTGPSVWTVKA